MHVGFPFRLREKVIFPIVQVDSELFLVRIVFMFWSEENDDEKI